MRKLLYTLFFSFVFILLFSANAFAVDKNSFNIQFFDSFNDEYLMQYVCDALEYNHSAKQATAIVEQYRRQTQIALGDELPQLRVNASYLGEHIPRLNINASYLGKPLQQLELYSFSKNGFILPFFLNYEADFFLKNRDKTKSAKKAYEASQFEEQIVYLALLSDVSTVYINILLCDDLIKNQENIVKLITNIYNAVNKQFNRGTISTTELNNVSKQKEQAQMQLEELYKQREILLMQLAVLTGKSATDAANLKRGNLADFEYQKVIPNEIQSDVIFARPDVKSAEAQLEKAKIDVRVARKEFLPSFNITGLWAFNTIAPGTFFSWESSLAALLAGATQDLFMGGKKIANLKFQKAKYEELFEKYRQTDLDAVKDVNTALCVIKYNKEIEKETANKLQNEMLNLNNMNKKFNRGVVSNIEYWMSESKVLEDKIDSDKAKTQRLVNYFTLYKAVGGKL